MATIKGESISAVDLSRVVIVSNDKQTKKNNLLSQSDLMWQEERKKRGVRKLTFEER